MVTKQGTVKARRIYAKARSDFYEASLTYYRVLDKPTTTNWLYVLDKAKIDYIKALDNMNRARDVYLLTCKS